MADIREQILSRLEVVCPAIQGIEAFVRNALDVPGIARPGIILHDGADTRAPPERQPAKRHRFGQIQMMELHPAIELRLRADTGAEAGSLASLFRGRIMNAILDDAQLQSLVTTNGDMWLENFTRPEPAPETKEPRANFEFVFLYPLRRSDLA